MASVEATVRAYFTALNGGDLEGIVRVFAEDGALLADEAETVFGHARLRDTFAATFQAISFQRDLQIDRIREDAETAVALTRTTGTFTLLDGDRTIAAVSRELFVLRKSGGEWRITEYMFNRVASPGAG